MFGRPHVLAEIPQDLTESNGQILTSDVSSVSGSRKRKRPEIAVGVDFQAVKLYNVCLAFRKMFRSN